MLSERFLPNPASSSPTTIRVQEATNPVRPKPIGEGRVGSRARKYSVRPDIICLDTEEYMRYRWWMKDGPTNK